MYETPDGAGGSPPDGGPAGPAEVGGVDVGMGVLGGSGVLEAGALGWDGTEGTGLGDSGVLGGGALGGG